MKPGGHLRPVIQNLAEKNGAYVVVSTTGSTSDSALKRRKKALREALADETNGEKLFTNFYDRNRLATWVRQHPGINAWVKEKTGIGAHGWRGYGAWCGGDDDEYSEYLLDDSLRMNFVSSNYNDEVTVIEGIENLRNRLANEKEVVRLVGLSGVGKTRLAQALFDPRIGEKALPESLAIYTDLPDSPNPQPAKLAEYLVAKRTRAILIIDNCGPDLHQRVCDICSAKESYLSLITIEYDVRDDQPERTEVVALEPSSLDVINDLVRKRFSYISQVDAWTIAEASGGNARIAIALAETVKRNESIGNISNRNLFERLFRQKNPNDESLLRTAEACSLVYSFNGESLEGAEAELPRLAALASQEVGETFRNVSELVRRNLVQKRNIWRAVLPHAISNYLAKQALENIHYSEIQEAFICSGNERLAKSFSRRLSYLHDHTVAIEIVCDWLKPDGLLGSVDKLGAAEKEMFENVASVAPIETLKSLERVSSKNPNASIDVWANHARLIRSLAYDAELFDRCAWLLERVCIRDDLNDEWNRNNAKDVLISLFPLYLSGTHATRDQRLNRIERLLRYHNHNANALGTSELTEFLKSTHFSSSYTFRFGARSRDFGYRPKTNDEIKDWFKSGLNLIEKLAVKEGILKDDLSRILSDHFRCLCAFVDITQDVVSLTYKVANGGFWRNGWKACRETIRLHGESLDREDLERLHETEEKLKPYHLKDQVRAYVLGGHSRGLDFGEIYPNDDIKVAEQRMDEVACSLAADVANSKKDLGDLLPELFDGGSRVFVFGRALAESALDRGEVWSMFVDFIEQRPTDKFDVQIIRGFIAGIAEKDRCAAHCLLDNAWNLNTVSSYMPFLETAIELDERSADRLIGTLNQKKASVSTFKFLALGRSSDSLPIGKLIEILRLICDDRQGYEIAVEILYMRMYSDRREGRNHDENLLEAGQEILKKLIINERTKNINHYIKYLIEKCLSVPEYGWVAYEVGLRFKDAISTFQINALNNTEILEALLAVQPRITLTSLFGDSGEVQQRISSFISNVSSLSGNPTRVVSSEDLVFWCDQEPKDRYIIAASTVSFAQNIEGTGMTTWSDQAIALINAAPNPEEVLKCFVARFSPQSWSRSRALIMERNASLLANLKAYLDVDLNSTILEEESQLRHEIEKEKSWEAERERGDHQRFE